MGAVTRKRSHAFFLKHRTKSRDQPRGRIRDVAFRRQGVKHLSHFSPLAIAWKIVFGDGQEFTFRARSLDVFHPSPPSSNPNARKRQEMYA